MTTWKRDDDDPPRDFTRADVAQIKDLLVKAEEAKAIHIFTQEQVRILTRVITTFTEHGTEIETMIKKERASKLLAELRLRFWGVVKWILAAMITITGIIQGWDWLMVRFFGGGK